MPSPHVTMGALDATSIPPEIAALPKADLHVHAETDARLDRVLALRDGRSPFAWREWTEELVAKVPPGMERLATMAQARRFEPTKDSTSTHEYASCRTRLAAHRTVACAPPASVAP